MSPRPNWPDWWQWDIELTPHLYKRMQDRDFTEVDLRAMLECAHSFRPDFIDRRWIIETRFRNKDWHVIIEPDPVDELLVVVTAYQVDSP